AILAAFPPCLRASVVKFMATSDENLEQASWPGLIQRIRARTPARVLVDRAGASYRTGTQLELRAAHAAARDAVKAEMELNRDLGAKFVQQWKLFEVATQAHSKDEYLLRPDLGRKFAEDAAEKIHAECVQRPDVQVVIGDGLSVTAVAAQVPALLPLIFEQAEQRGWKLGRSEEH